MPEREILVRKRLIFALLLFSLLEALVACGGSPPTTISGGPSPTSTSGEPSPTPTNEEPSPTSTSSQTISKDELFTGFCNAILHLDWNTAYSYTSGGYRQNATVYTLRTVDIEPAIDDIDPKQCSMTADSTSDRKATLVITGVLSGTNDDGSTWSHPVEFDIPVDLIQDPDGWKIDVFDSVDATRKFLDG